jgi:hypothetical protein
VLDGQSFLRESLAVFFPGEVLFALFPQKTFSRVAGFGLRLSKWKALAVGPSCLTCKRPGLFIELFYSKGWLSPSTHINKEIKTC